MAECKKLKKDFDGRGLNDLAQTSLEEASTIQSDLENVTKHMSEKILSVVEEFACLRKPLYNKRHTILRSVPHFWAIAFMNHPKLKLLINNSVEDCFNYLQYLQVIENDLKSGYQVIFEFDTNPYFYNNKLVKNFFCDNGVYTMRKTCIDWKENMNLCERERKTNGRKRGLPLENFFDWMMRTGSNDVICDIIRDDLWIDPLKYFFLPDDANDDNSESDSEDDYECDDLLESKDDETGEDDATQSDNDFKDVN